MKSNTEAFEAPAHPLIEKVQRNRAWKQWTAVASGADKPGAAIAGLPWGNDVTLFSVFPNDNILQPSGEICQGLGNPFANPPAWATWQQVSGDEFSLPLPLGSAITTVPWGNRLAIFAAGDQGSVFLNIGYPQTDDWAGWAPINLSQTQVVPGTPVTAVVWGNGVVLFMTQSQGTIMYCSGDPNDPNSFTPWVSLHNVTSTPGAPIAAVPWGNRIAIFVTDFQGGIDMNIGYPQTDDWTGWTLTRETVDPGTPIPPGAPLTAVAWGNSVALFMINSKSQVCQSVGDPNQGGAPGNWTPWNPITIVNAKPGAPVTAFPYENQMTLYVTDKKGTVYTTTGYPQTDGWLTWTSIGNVAFAPGGAVVAVPWIGGAPALFAVGTDNTLYSTAPAS